MVSGTPEGYRVYDTLRGLSVSGASAVFSCSGLRIHKTRFRLHTARVSSRQHGGQDLPLPERGHTGRHKAKDGGYHSPLQFRSWWAHMCKVCPRAALGSGDFPCKWHFDIKMRCLRHQERTEYGVVFCQELMPLKSPIMGCPFGWNCAIFPTNKGMPTSSVHRSIAGSRAPPFRAPFG